MKTNLLKSIVLVASLMVALGSASAETLRVRIPFGFTADGTTMPAGLYSIRPMPNAPILLFENEETKAQTLVFARFASGIPVKAEDPLTFTATSEHKELSNIATVGWTYELSTHTARRSSKSTALTLTSGSK